MRQADVYGVPFVQAEVTDVKLVLEIADTVAFDHTFLTDEVTIDHIVIFLFRRIDRLFYFNRQFLEGIVLVGAQFGVKTVVAAC
jgi:hypothetical protein